ncbi:hypothetical protein GTA51_06765 [Desulfovibrio aerotolerans]|uniref:Uncharacterized protein n=1 Tax=Solidesulfovibrio aerotolerans TaxID=295255 RepID=A0A7C9N028_9BACT|nr:hypothetical protein [Solidesulfovibrio aerotolerans]MYL82837.1 hypothetical protein [Solidesulfovibrio aerotolerans]
MQIPSLSSGIKSLLTATSQPGSQSSEAASGHVSLTLDTGSSQKKTAAAGSSTFSLTTSDVFAAEVMRRIESAQTPVTASNAGAGVNMEAAGDLQSALAGAVETVRAKHGDAAATAVMGIVIKGVGDGTGGEDALGDAMVSALKFIDRNFGVAAGDAAMANFNGALNTSINAFYQNGHLEEFYAADGSGGLGSAIKQAQGVVSSTLAHVTKAFGEDAAKAVADILKTDFTDTGATREGLGKAVVAANAYLSENYGASPLDIPTQEQTYLPKGTVLSLAV